jgi:tRNA-specific 2-thiouridylase
MIGPGEIEAQLGGLASTHRHAAVLAADALHRALSSIAGFGERLAEPSAAGERVLVALSGGVDSAVAALRERGAGREVVAVTLKLWADQRTDGERSCCSPEAVLGARRLAHSLGIPHLTLDLEGEFRAGVVGPFIRGYAAGRTPNPCVLCNGELRIDAMIALADRLGASKLATGHYARIVDDGAGPLLARAADEAKDQTYMLAGLRPESLGRLRFPLGELTKPEVRALAAEAGLEVAGRAESQDLCFLAGQGKREFLRRHAGLEDRSGEVVDRARRRLGEHRGYHHFTVGQRRGLGVGGGKLLYVLGTEPATNTVIAGTRAELATQSIRIRGATLHRPAERVDGVRLRYHSPRTACRLEVNGDLREAVVALAKPVDGAAPGQVACLMDGDLVVGHGTIV